MTTRPRGTSSTRRPRLTPRGGFLHVQGPNFIDYEIAPSDMFKSIVLRVCFVIPLTRAHAAMGAIIPALLRRGTTAHPNSAALSRRCEELYGASLKTATVRIGRHQLLSVSLRFPAPRYMSGKTGDLLACVDLARELIMEPLSADGGFVPDLFASERSQLLNSIRSLADNKPGYVMREALKISFPSGPYGVPEYGSEADVEALEPRRAWRFFERARASAPCTIYIAGPLDPARHLPPIIKKFAAIERRRPGTLPANRTAPRAAGAARRGARRGAERMAMEQAFVALTHTTASNIGSADFAAALYANAMYGQLATSRLFRVVREEHGLAYAVSSSLDDVTGLSMAYAGTDPAKLGRARALMGRELERLRRKGFSGEEFEAARNSLVEDALSSQDSASHRIAARIIQRAVGSNLTPERRLALLRAVTPDDVRRAYRRYAPRAEFRLIPK